MKLKVFLITAVFPLLFSCGWQVPEKISVKTGAEYAMSVGDFEESLSDYVNVAEISKLINQKNSDAGQTSGAEYSISVYDYNPDAAAKIQQFLIDVPIEDVPLDLDAYFEKLDFDSEMEDISFEKKITTPDFAEQVIPGVVQLPDVRSLLLAAPYSSGTFDCSDSGAGSYTDVSKSAGIVFAGSAGFDFESIYFAGGNFDVRLTASFPENCDFNVTNAVLYSEDTDAVVSSISSVNKYVSSSGILLSFPMAGSYLTKNLTLKINGKEINSVSGNPQTYTFTVTGEINSSSVISKVTGLTKNFSDTVQNFTQAAVYNESSADFVEATVSASSGGTLSISSKLQDDWSGINITSRSISVTDAATDSAFIDADSGWDTDSETDSYLVNRSADLSSKVIKKDQALKIYGEFIFGFANATITFNSYGTINPVPVVTDIKINRLDSLIVDFSSYSENLKTDYSREFPDSMKNYVEWMKLKPCGLKVTYTNNLPAGNDLTMTVNSSVFDISGVTQTMTAETYGGNVNFTSTFGTSGTDPYSTPDGEDFVVKKIEPDASGSKIDVNVQIGLPQVSESGGTIYAKLVNLDLSREYKIAVNVEPDFNWYSLSIKFNGSGDSTSTTGQIDSDFGFDSMFNEVVECFGGAENDHFFKNLRFTSLPFYVYLTKPEGDTAFEKLFENFSMTGKIKISSNDSNGVYLCGSEDGKSSITVSKIQELVKDADGTVISNLNNKSSGKIDIAGLFVSGTGNFLIDYDISLATGSAEAGSSAEGVEVKYSDYQDYKSKKAAGSAAASVGVYARMVLPLQLQVQPDQSSTDTIANLDSYADIMWVAKMKEKDGDGNVTQKDFFGRGEATDTETMDKYTRIVKAVTINYSVNNQLFSSSSYLDFDLSGVPAVSGRTLNETDYNLILKENSFSITRNDFYYWMECYPFTPKVLVIIPSGSNIYIPRNAKFGGNFSVKLTCDDNQEIVIMGDD